MDWLHRGQSREEFLLGVNDLADRFIPLLIDIYRCTLSFLLFVLGAGLQRHKLFSVFTHVKESIL